MDKRTLDIVNFETSEVAQSVDVTGLSEHTVERVLSGMLRNLDTENWYVRDSEDG